MSRICHLLLLNILLSTLPAWSQQHTRIFVYAPRETGARTWQPIWCDGILVAKMKRGTFFAIDVTPGRHVLQQSNGVPSFVEVAAGDEKFMRTGLQVQLGQAAVAILDKVNPDVAHNELRFASYIDEKQVFSPSVSKLDPRPHLDPHLRTRNEP